MNNRTCSNFTEVYLYVQMYMDYWPIKSHCLCRNWRLLLYLL